MTGIDNSGGGETAPAETTAAAAPVRRPVVEARAISKYFGGHTALDHVDFELAPDEVHALLGENGAGKTTLSNIFAGIYRADAGELVVEGEPCDFKTPSQAIDAGIGMVHQHFRLVRTMTVAENIHLGWPDTPRVVRRRDLVARTNELMERVGLHVDPNARIWQLSVGEQQRVEILRVLARGAKVLILDEPTAVLTATEAEELFAVVRRLVANGHSVILISHKLHEVLSVSDRITVLRNGARVATVAAQTSNVKELARLMTGEERELVVERRSVVDAPMLELRGVSVHDARGLKALDSIDLTVNRGEIVGIAGVSGNGQSELAQVVSGLRPLTSGSITIDGDDVTRDSVRSIIDRGVGHIPEDRIGVGMVPSASVENNAVLRHYWSSELSNQMTVKRSAIKEFARRMVEVGRVQTRSISAPAGQMSGGNQQRLVARREALVAGRVLVAAHPTRGLDVNAAQEVQSSVLERRDAGCAVLYISDDLDEVMLVSDRIAVMYEGRIVDVVDAADADRERLGLLMGGYVAVDGATAGDGVGDGEVDR